MVSEKSLKLARELLTEGIEQCSVKEAIDFLEAFGEVRYIKDEDLNEAMIWVRERINAKLSSD